jgi:hypothetical protein
MLEPLTKWGQAPYRSPYFSRFCGNAGASPHLFDVLVILGFFVRADFFLPVDVYFVPMQKSGKKRVFT